MRFILASASPRRKELLALLLKDFEIRQSSIDENLNIRNAPHLCMRLSYDKALDVAATTAGEAVIIAADTIVVLKNRIMGKPQDEEDAFGMLFALSGRTHYVYTGLTVLDTAGHREVTQYEKTAVTFNRMTPQEIKEYIKTGEPMDKAGAYGIQGYTSRFIKKINGCYFNVVGLPVSRLYKIIKSLGYLEYFY